MKTDVEDDVVSFELAEDVFVDSLDCRRDVEMTEERRQLAPVSHRMVFEVCRSFDEHKHIARPGVLCDGGRSYHDQQYQRHVRTDSL